MVGERRLRGASPSASDAVEIEQVYVTPWRRGYGLGPRLIESALAAGGRDDAWIVADDEDRPRLIYERLGFRTVWRRTRSSGSRH